MPSFPKHPPLSSTFEPIAHNIVLAQKLCLGTTAGATALCVQCPARVAIIDSKCDTTRRGDGRGTGRGEGFKEPDYGGLKDANKRHLNASVVSIV